MTYEYFRHNKRRNSIPGKGSSINISTTLEYVQVLEYLNNDQFKILAIIKVPIASNKVLTDLKELITRYPNMTHYSIGVSGEDFEKYVNQEIPRAT